MRDLIGGGRCLGLRLLVVYIVIRERVLIVGFTAFGC